MGPDPLDRVLTVIGSAGGLPADQRGRIPQAIGFNRGLGPDWPELAFSCLAQRILMP